jgi:hypothetical protein
MLAVLIMGELQVYVSQHQNSAQLQTTGKLRKRFARPQFSL